MAMAGTTHHARPRAAQPAGPAARRAAADRLRPRLPDLGGARLLCLLVRTAVRLPRAALRDPDLVLALRRLGHPRAGRDRCPPELSCAAAVRGGRGVETGRAGREPGPGGAAPRRLATSLRAVAA